MKRELARKRQYVLFIIKIKKKPDGHIGFLLPSRCYGNSGTALRDESIFCPHTENVRDHRENGRQKQSTCEDTNERFYVAFDGFDK